MDSNIPERMGVLPGKIFLNFYLLNVDTCFSFQDLDLKLHIFISCKKLKTI